MTDEYYMGRALELAAQAGAAGEVPVGALLVKNGEVVGEGYNQPISSCDPTAHAEVVAMRNAAAYLNNYRLTGCDLYVTIEPCTMCLGAMIHARVKRIIFGAKEPRAGALTSQLQLLDRSSNQATYRSSSSVLNCFLGSELGLLPLPPSGNASLKY